MRVANARQIFAAGTKLHGNHALGNQLTGHRTNDMDAQDFVSDGVGQHLDHAGGVAQRACTAIRQEWKGTRLISTTSRLELLLGLSKTSDTSLFNGLI